MSRSQSRCMMLILRHAWLNLLDKHMTTGRINQVAVVVLVHDSGKRHHNSIARLIRVFDKLNKSLSHKSKSSFAIVKYHALRQRLSSISWWQSTARTTGFVAPVQRRSSSPSHHAASIHWSSRRQLVLRVRITVNTEGLTQRCIQLQIGLKKIKWPQPSPTRAMAEGPLMRRA